MNLGNKFSRRAPTSGHHRLLPTKKKTLFKKPRPAAGDRIHDARRAAAAPRGWAIGGGDGGDGGGGGVGVGASDVAARSGSGFCRLTTNK